MARRIKCKIGDVVMIPIFEDKYGLGRVLNKDEDAVLLELYSMELISNIESTDYKSIVANNEKVILWGFDEAIKKGGWRIVGNIGVELPVEMPMYYGWSYMSDGSTKYYIAKGNYNDALSSVGEKMWIEKSETLNYLCEGIDFPNMAILDYAKFLLKEGVISKLPDMGQSQSESTKGIKETKEEKSEDKDTGVKPFMFYKDEDGVYYVTLNADGTYKQAIFEEFEEDGYLGNGYDWEAIAMLYIEENMADYSEDIEFDSEGGMFVAYSENGDVLEKFVIGFKNACENEDTMRDLLKNTEPM